MRNKPLKTVMSTMDLWKKIAVIVICAALIRLGSVFPLPFVNAEYMQAVLGEGLGFFNAITGGSFYQMSFFALSISPYITASIIMELLCVAVPALEDIKKDGKTGRDRIKKYTVILAVSLALIEAAAMAVGLGRSGLLEPYTVWTAVAAIVIWTAGAAVLIAIGEFLSLMNIGSGISILLVLNILASVPSDIRNLYTVYSVRAQNVAFGIVTGVIIFAIFAGICAVCVILCTTKKKIRVTSARKLAGQADNTFPIPLNTCSVMPVIFAGSVMSLPLVISRFVPAMQDGVIGSIVKLLSSSYWFMPEYPLYTFGAVIYFLLTTFFTYFYLEIGFNAGEIADNFKKSNIMIPGIRPGTPTADYIRHISTRVALLGNTLTTLLILFMYLICNVSGLGSLSIAGTSVIICVSVILEEKDLLTAAAKVKYCRNTAWLPLGEKAEKI